MIVVARGTILDGTQPAGKIGGDSTAALIRQARNDDDVKAIVLRVDSGGGSAFASEVIRRECEAARAAGKPVIASMGSVAASGGYWISTSSDQIWAHPSTITGSIGIFGMIPTYQRPLAEHLGIHVDGIGTAPLAGVRLDRELPPEVGEVIQEIIEHGYREFLQRVADSRGMTTEEVDKVAQGRVWSGTDAYELGLVDHLGDLDDAVAAAAELAELGDDYAVSYIEKEEEFKDKMIREMLAQAMERSGQDAPVASPLDEMLGRDRTGRGGLRGAQRSQPRLRDVEHRDRLSCEESQPPTGRDDPSGGNSNPRQKTSATAEKTVGTSFRACLRAAGKSTPFKRLSTPKAPAGTQPEPPAEFRHR